VKSILRRQARLPIIDQQCGKLDAYEKITVMHKFELD